MDEQRPGDGDGHGDDADPAAGRAGGARSAGAGADDTGGARSAEAGSGQGGAVARTPLTQQIGRGVVLVLIALFGVFAASNAQPVDFSWVVGATEVTDGPGATTEGGVPLIVLLLVSFVVGAVVGALLAWQTGRARRRQQPPADRGEGPSH